MITFKSKFSALLCWTVLIVLLKIHITVCTSPFFLWKVINTTIERKLPSKDSDWNPSQCPRLIFHNNETLGAQPEFLGTAGQSIAIDVTDINDPLFEFPSFKRAQEFLDYESNKTIKAGDTYTDGSTTDPTTRKLHEPCITVISIVNTTGMTFDRTNISFQLMQLLQYNTPIRKRHLFLVRLGNKEEDLFDSAVFKGAAEFPLRLMPLWEMVLFDFFMDARIIQGLSMESEHKSQNSLKVSSDPGIWVWLCNDIIEAMEKRQQCLVNREGNGDCQIWKSLTDMRNTTCAAGFSPRH